MKLSAQLDPIHWQAKHRDLFAAWTPRSVRIINPDRERIRRILEVSPQSLIVLRDHPMSEQHDNLRLRPEETAVEHATRWAALMNGYGVGVRDQFIVLGINEPHVWEPGVAQATDRYSLRFMQECDRFRLRAGIFSFSTGWPADYGTKDSPVDWRPYKASLDYVEANRQHFVMLHEYWCKEGPRVTTDLRPAADGGPWGWNPGRYTQLTRDVPIIIGECGLEQLVCDPAVPMDRRGWRAYLSPQGYQQQLMAYDHAIQKDKRIHSAQIFIMDSHSEWSSLWYDNVIPLLGANKHYGWYVDTGVPPPPDTGDLVSILKMAARKAQVLSLNPKAGLQQAIANANLWPVGNEVAVQIGDATYMTQRAEPGRGGVGATFWVKAPKWSDVKREND